MEAHKERAEQLRKMEDEEAARNTTRGRVEDSGPTSTSVDPAAKVLIRETIISDTKAGGGSAEDPEDVLIYSRTVNKIDSSLE